MKKLNAKIILSMIIGMIVFSNITNAAVRTWTGTVSTSWNNSANWLEGQIPGINDEVVFDIAVPNKDCLLDVSATINKLTINNLYGSQLTLPSGNTLSIMGDISIFASSFAWDNTTNIILIGNGDQTITVDDPFGDFFFFNLKINKPSGSIILGSDITVTNGFSNLSGTPIGYNGFSIIVLCTPPQTGGIYHIANDFAL